MFEAQKAKLKDQLQSLEEDREWNDKEEQRLKKELEALEEKEKQLKAKGVSEGKQSFTLAENDFDCINKDFVKNANAWIKNHEEKHHPGVFFQTEDFRKNKALYLQPGYTATIDWTHVGRLVAIVCNVCKKQYTNTSEKSEEYMYCDEA